MAVTDKRRPVPHLVLSAHEAAAVGSALTCRLKPCACGSTTTCNAQYPAIRLFRKSAYLLYEGRSYGEWVRTWPQGSEFVRRFSRPVLCCGWNLIVSGHFMSCLQSMYAQDSAEGAISSETFKCLQGLKQGSPLSPLQSGLMIDVWGKLLRNVKHNHAPQLVSNDVPLLLFADDLVLMSKSEESPQQFLNALQMFCDNSRLKVSLAKTEVVLVCTPAPRLRNLQICYTRLDALRQVQVPGPIV